MKLTPYGETSRLLRMRTSVSMKEMADHMGISSSHLSGIEYGEKRLAQKHIDAALNFFTGRSEIKTADLNALRNAAESSKDVVVTSSLNPDARGLVAAFARRLQEGDAPTPEIVKWLKNKGR